MKHTLLVFSALLTAVPLQAQSTSIEIPGWGRFEDPGGQATVEVDGEALLMTSGRNRMTVEDTLGSMPRMVRDVHGDFDVRVRVLGSFAPHQKAVLLAFAGPGEYLRIMTGLGLYRASVELSTDIVTGGEVMNTRQHRPRHPSLWLRVRRVGGQLNSYYSTDGQEWLFSATSQDIALADGGGVSFTQPVQVMLLVHNQTRGTPLTVRFETLELQQGAEMHLITVGEDPDEKARRLYEEARAKQIRTILIGFALTIVVAFGWIFFITGLRGRNAFRFSVRRLIGFVTLVCASLGVANFFVTSDGQVDTLIASIPTAFLAAVTALSIYAACDPWLRCPAALDEVRSATGSDPFRTGLTTRVLAILIGVFFLLAGGLAAALFVEDNWSMDTGGASSTEWLLGLPFIASTMIGSFARGASLVGFLALLCGVPLGRHFAKHFGLCGGSLLALLLWVPAHDVGEHWAAENHGMWNAYGSFVSGIVGLLLLGVCWWIAGWFLGRGVIFGRSARRWAGRLFLFGLVVGAIAFFIPGVRWLLAGIPVLGPTIGCGLGAILGMLTRASENSSMPGANPFQQAPS